MALGIERIIVLDNGSTDATPTILHRMQRRHPVSVTRDEGPFRQDEFMTGLLQEAARAGADWVVPFDDDEFLVSDEPLPERLGYVQRDGILVRVVNFIQRRDGRRESPRALLTMTARADRPVEATQARALVLGGGAAIVEAQWPRNLILRPSPGARLEVGSHGADGVEALELADWCRFLHAPIRSEAGLRDFAEHGRRLRGLRAPGAGWQHFLMADAADDGRLDEQWRLNSWDGDLAVGPGRSPVVADTRLADAVRPCVRSPARQIAARIARRPY